MWGVQILAQLCAVLTCRHVNGTLRFDLFIEPPCNFKRRLGGPQELIVRRWRIEESTFLSGIELGRPAPGSTYCLYCLVYKVKATNGKSTFSNLLSYAVSTLFPDVVVLLNALCLSILLESKKCEVDRT